MTPSPTPAGRHAVVCGGSLSSLFAVGVLARHFERVTLVERDRFQASAEPRKGVPQGAQTHILLRRGLDIGADIFPGLLEELRQAGAVVQDTSLDWEWFIAGIWRRRVPTGIETYSLTRPLLEWKLRARVAALPNVRILDGQEVTRFTAAADGGRVTGLGLRAPGGSEETVLEADLVVDASGRGSRTPQWLEALGYPRVEETARRMDLGYATRMYQPQPGFEPGWKTMIISQALPEVKRSGGIFSVEGGRWSVTVSSWLGEPLPTDDQGFLDFTRTLLQPHLYESLRNAVPLGPAVGYRFAQSQWRHYERLPRVPEGLAVVGDAYCSFNPVYGQGITTGALMADALDGCLREGLEGLSRRYFARAGKVLEAPWMMAGSEDLRHPAVEGKRPFGHAAVQWYSDRLQRLTAVDGDAVKAFMEVMHMLAPPTAMFRPGLALKTLAGVPRGAALPAGPQLPSRGEEKAA
jgi:2-polyprenyl-6-methoxyphenol hydroxylase-like FAD-dependent oxidoreductase